MKIEKQILQSAFYNTKKFEPCQYVAGADGGGGQAARADGSGLHRQFPRRARPAGTLHPGRPCSIMGGKLLFNEAISKCQILKLASTSGRGKVAVS
ncbi:MAG: hypothetical protein LBP23_09910, partial [Treponema sp.]|nr:hypothetical protein [Treponema sp.]